MIMKSWSPELTFEEIDFSTTDFWVQIHNLPFGRMTPENARAIGNLVGRYKSRDGDTDELTLRKKISESEGGSSSE